MPGMHTPGLETILQDMSHPGFPAMAHGFLKGWERAGWYLVAGQRYILSANNGRPGSNFMNKNRSLFNMIIPEDKYLLSILSTLPTISGKVRTLPGETSF